VAGEVVRIGNAQVWGGRNVPSQMPGPASRLYAQNVVNLLTLMTAADPDGADGADGADRSVGAHRFAPDPDDEIVAGCCVTRDGAILHEPTRQALEGDSQ
jgi:NAD(P) transhydrogenase subunit alpha